MPGVLDEILENKRGEIARLKAAVPLAELKQQAAAAAAAADFVASLRQPGVSIIAEIKPRSPSMGTLRESLPLDDIVKIYSRHARGISVLTDERYFGGSLDLLAKVSCATSVPTLCKDFVLDEHQVYSARIAGASAVLLIVKALDDERLSSLHATIQALNMVPVVEVQNEAELDRALKVSPDVVLVNNRNLDTMEIDLATSEKLIPEIPKSVLAISASGISEPTDIERLLPLCKTFLIGSSLMLADDIEHKLSSLVGAADTVGAAREQPEKGADS